MTMTQGKFNRRLITVWFAITGFLFSVTSFIAHGIFIHLFFTAACGCVGFLWGYKSIEQPATKPNMLAVRITAGIWTAILFNPLFLTSGGFLWEVAFTSRLLENSVSFSLTTTVINLILFAIGWLFTYKVLLLPNIKYQTLYPTTEQRNIAAAWFGVLGLIFSLAALPFLLFLLSYFGFAYGSRMLIQPSSLKGTIRVIIDGIIGTTYALAIVTASLMIQKWELGSLKVSQPMNTFAIFSLTFCWTGILASLFMRLGYGISRRGQNIK